MTQPSQQQHAPTPWKMVHEGTGVCIRNAEGDAIAYPNLASRTRWAVRNGLSGIEEGDANAAFIAEACNAYDRDKATIKALVEALKGLLDNSSPFDKVDPDTEEAYWDDAYYAAKKALALAKEAI